MNTAPNPNSPRRIAILTSGGDAPGMNAAIRAAASLVLAHGAEAIGVRMGYRGLLEGDFVPLHVQDISGIIRDGGTMLGSARCLEFMECAGRDQARARLREAGIDGLIVIGGNGSLTGARALVSPEELGDQRLSVVGVPASIDNDIGLTGMSIGVDTAMNTIVEACDRICDTASAHDRTFIVEVMGRDCGYLAMTAAVAAGADAVLFPESDKDDSEAVETVVRAIQHARNRPGAHRRVLIIKAEGTSFPLAALKEQLDARLTQLFPEGHGTIETRVTVLGHIVRGGRPSAFDRLLACRLTRVAIEALLAGQNAKMAAWMQAGDMPADIAQRAVSDPYCWLVDLDAVLAETQRLLNGTSPLVRWRKHVFEQIEDVLTFQRVNQTPHPS
ncbi:MAG: ATP-dependent 6-phosphofructokinase [Myxococcota bacterium]